MVNDIGEDILNAIREGMAQEISGKGKIAEIIAKAENGKANFNDVSELSTQLGNALSRLIAANVTPDKLPNGKLYYNIANTFLTGSLRDNYDLINLTAQAVQEIIDNRNGIMIEPQKAEFPADRVHAIVNAVSDETADWSTIERRLDSPVRNVTESFYNDYVEANAEFRSDAGFKPYIIRETDGNCCAWCSSLAGQYEYPNDVPPDVYARHDNCTCTVTYVTDKYRQDVWSKKRYALTPEERKNVLENTPKAERFTRQQAKDVEKSNLKDAVGVANSRESGIIESENKFRTKNDPMVEAMGSAEQSHPEEIKQLERHLKDIGVELIRPDHEKLDYEPGLRPGQPGRVNISKGASYSACLHEVKHADDDMKDGWLGMRVFQDPDKCAQREIDAYQIEIDMAKAIGRDDIAERLEALRDEEIQKYGY